MSESNVGYDLILAILAIITAAGTGIFNYFFSKKQKSNDAYTDYVYSARKRLYENCEPILFQFTELSESALRRIVSLAENAKDGNLGPNRMYLSHLGYYAKSTIYRLLIPMAAFKIFQRQLTQVDLKLDANIKNQYSLAKILYYTFPADYDFAKSEPTLSYDPEFVLEPNTLTMEQIRDKHKEIPGKYSKQGMRVGLVDNLTEALIKEESSGTLRLISYGEFEKRYFEPNVKEPFDKIEYLFTNFHPKTRPILWRILLAQALLYKAIQNIRMDGNTGKPVSLELFDEISYVDPKLFDWRQATENVSEDEALIQPFTAAKNYLQKQLKIP